MPRLKIRPQLARIKAILVELEKKYRAGDIAAYSLQKKTAGGARERCLTWFPNEINYLFRSALYFKPEIKGPFAKDENPKALQAAAWTLITRKCLFFIFINRYQCKLGIGCNIRPIAHNKVYLEYVDHW